jgi:hypothetical protein
MTLLAFIAYGTLVKTGDVIVALPFLGRWRSGAAHDPVVPAGLCFVVDDCWQHCVAIGHTGAPESANSR